MKVLLHEKKGGIIEKELAEKGGFPAIIVIDDCQHNRGFQRIAIDKGVGEYVECDTITVMP